MTAKVILNPYANRWNALKRKDEVEAALRDAGIAYELVVTQAPGHAVDLACQAVWEGCSPIIAAGGDGTYSEVVNGMMQGCHSAGGFPPVSDQSPVFGVLPLGSANDLPDNLKMPKDLPAAVRVIAAGNVRCLDLCQVDWQSAEASGTRYFDNNSAIGLEPYITLIQQRITWLHGTMRYLVATLRGVMDNPQWAMLLEWDGGQYEGPISLVTVGNSPRTGGVFYVTPHADPFDGLLTFVYGFIPTRGQILTVLPRLMKPGEGNYVEHPAIHEVHAQRLKIEVMPGKGLGGKLTPMHADGEIQTDNVLKLEYSVLPRRLPLLMPES